MSTQMISRDSTCPRRANPSRLSRLWKQRHRSSCSEAAVVSSALVLWYRDRRIFPELSLCFHQMFTLAAGYWLGDHYDNATEPTRNRRNDRRRAFLRWLHAL